MSRFTTPLRFEDTGRSIWGRQIYRILEPFDYELGFDGSNNWIHVPAGFETDFGSIPRLFWMFVSPVGPYGKAFVLHDWLYRKASGHTKIVADALLYEALGILECPWILKRAIFDGVYYFGHFAYNWEATAPKHTELAMLDESGKVKPYFTGKEPDKLVA